jgi:general secretion pathway protein M
MMDDLRDWWNGRTPREHVLLAVLGVLVLGLVSWLLIWRPVNSYLDTSRTTQGEALDRLSRTQAMVAEAKRLGPVKADGAVDAGAIIAQSAIEAGFTLAKNEQGQPGQYQIVISAAKARALFAWLGVLERQGVIAQTANVRSNGDGTVTFEAVLRGRGA